MTANVRIITDSRESVARVPNAALRFRPPDVAASDAAVTLTSDDSTSLDVDGGEPVAHGKGRGDGRAQLERLARELSLTQDQRKRVAAVFADNVARMGEISNLEAGDRRKQMDRLRAQSRQRIGDILTADQRQRYEAMRGCGAP